ncbi:Uu.00g064150.m01.CDS01 [Anthostomella pinea]|uniref:Uu.00g064150.m01.CDS01 n=1 Tax=Anthostomella pinea TaxID=933095 RepID=A0AAI8YN38_9PEZI|nr:Uu.00g064150.m01.CDS01 [Anthostomella pinea]
MLTFVLLKSLGAFRRRNKQHVYPSKPRSFEEYRRYARDLVELHEEANRGHGIKWFYRENQLVENDIKAFARGELMNIHNKLYVMAVLDEFQLLPHYVDLLVDCMGLKHADGAANCAAWLPQRDGTSELIEQRDSLFKRVRDKLWCSWEKLSWHSGQYNTPTPIVPFIYLATCVNESTTNETQVKALLHAIDILDKKFFFLRLQNGCVGPFPPHPPAPGQKDSHSTFAAVLTELKRGNLDLSEFESRRDLWRDLFSKSDTFMDDLFGPRTVDEDTADEEAEDEESAEEEFFDKGFFDGDPSDGDSSDEETEDEGAEDAAAEDTGAEDANAAEEGSSDEGFFDGNFTDEESEDWMTSEGSENGE